MCHLFVLKNREARLRQPLTSFQREAIAFMVRKTFLGRQKKEIVLYDLMYFD